MKRGIQGCTRFCAACKKDCKCETCNYCHTCQYYNAYNNGGNGHVWTHNCTGSTSPPDIGSFLRDTSDRFARFCGSEVYTIKIGDDKTYFIHSDALRQTSPVLKKQMELEMKEKKTQTIELKDNADNERAFVLFVQFSYFGTYGYDDNGKEDAFQVHALVYVFAEKLEVLELKSLALRKATLLCSKAVNDKSADSLVRVLQFSLSETVPIIYSSTYDINTGKYPSTLKEVSEAETISTPAVARDGFRMLLARFAAQYIDKLRHSESFTTVLEEQPAFAADVLLFAGSASTFTTDGKGNLEF